jgi:hypothetical protein
MLVPKMHTIETTNGNGAGLAKTVRTAANEHKTNQGTNKAGEYTKNRRARL